MLAVEVEIADDGRPQARRHTKRTPPPGHGNPMTIAAAEAELHRSRPSLSVLVDRIPDPMCSFAAHTENLCTHAARQRPPSDRTRPQRQAPPLDDQLILQRAADAMKSQPANSEGGHRARDCRASAPAATTSAAAGLQTSHPHSCTAGCPGCQDVKRADGTFCPAGRHRSVVRRLCRWTCTIGPRGGHQSLRACGGRLCDFDRPSTVSVSPDVAHAPDSAARCVQFHEVSHHGPAGGRLSWNALVESFPC
jgi:hypothetical protein